MKNFLARLLLAAAAILVAFAVTSIAHAQQADEDAAPATPHQQEAPASPSTSPQKHSTLPEQHANNPSASCDEQTQDALPFTGSAVEQDGAIVLSDPVTKMTYLLDVPSKARSYVGNQVKIVGKLEMKSNTIRIERVEVVHCADQGPSSRFREPGYPRTGSGISRLYGSRLSKIVRIRASHSRGALSPTDPGSDRSTGESGCTHPRTGSGRTRADLSATFESG